MGQNGPHLAMTLQLPKPWSKPERKLVRPGYVADSSGHAVIVVPCGAGTINARMAFGESI